MLRLLTRCAAVLSSLGGIAALFYGVRYLSQCTFARPADFFVFVLATPGPALLLIGCTLLRGAYLAWFCWSPLAARHLVGALFFIPSIAAIAATIHLAPGGWWKLAASMTVLAVCYCLFRITATWLGKAAFKEQSQRPSESTGA